MPRMSYERTRRVSKPSQVPNALVFNHDLALHRSLQTPPPTAVHDTSASWSRAKQLMNSEESRTAMQMPATPMTPNLPTLEQQRCASASLYSSVVNRQRLDLTNAGDSESIVRPRKEYSASHKTDSQLKRERDEAADSIEAPSVKKRLRSKDLIGKPFFELQRYDVPAPYIRKCLLQLSKSLFNNAANSTVWLGSRKPRMSRSSESMLRVKVVPRRDPDSAFFMSHVRLNDDAPIDMPASGLHDDDDEDEDPSRESEDESVPPLCLPLHVEVAWLRVPLLGQLILSGKVFRGDYLEVELPHPEDLSDTMYWIYTGSMRIENERRIRENVQVLSGRRLDEDV